MLIARRAAIHPHLCPNAMRTALLALGLLLGAPVEAQYRRGVLVYDSQCPLRVASQLKTSTGVQLSVNGNLHGARSLDAPSGVTVTISSSQVGGTPQSITTSTRFASVLYTNADAGSTCEVRSRTIATDSVVNWSRNLASNADRERRKWGRIRNALFVGSLAVLGATVYNFNNEVERDGEGDAVTLIAGSALGLTIAYLGFNQAQPEVADYTRIRNRYREIERQILEQAR